MTKILRELHKSCQKEVRLRCPAWTSPLASAAAASAAREAAVVISAV